MATDPARITTPERTAEDADAALRPKSLDEFIGQQAARENLRVFVDAAKSRGEALDHVLLHGPPGLGKTTLAGILAREMGVGFRATSGPVIAKSGDLAALLTNLEDGDVLFIDEIHRLNPAVEEVLYPAMEDRALDLMIGEGPSARSVRIDLPRFTLIGATTRQGLLTTPLRDRFGIPVRLNFYTVEELEQVVRRAARLLGVDARPTTARARSRAARAARRASPAGCCGGCAISPMPSGADTIDAEVADKALSRLEIDALGLDAMDRRYLTMIADLYGGGPVGVETLAAGLSEPRDTIEDVIEPYLIQLGLIARTARGRCLNGRGYAHLGLPAAAGQPGRPVRPGSVRRNNATIWSLLWPRPLFAAARRHRPPRPPAPAAAPRLCEGLRTGCACPAARDACSTPLATTALNPNGYGSIGRSTVAKDPPLDCFYVYPTVSRDQGMNSDLNAGRRRSCAAAGPVRALRLACAGPSRRSTAR